MLHYEIVDVFTDVAFTGNPLAVVLDADDLSTEQMQALAREFNLSETAFPLPSTVADYRLRIFTPQAELPFAGHPSIGAAHTLARLGRLTAGPVVQECGAGLLPLHVAADSVRLTGGTPGVGERLEPQASLRALAAEAPGGLSVLSWDSTSAVAHARVFSVDISEDPATGSAALGLGGWLVASGLLAADGASSYTVRQGAELLRPSVLHCTVAARDGVVIEATVSGNVVPVASGTILRP